MARCCTKLICERFGYCMPCTAGTSLHDIIHICGKNSQLYRNLFDVGIPSQTSFHNTSVKNETDGNTKSDMPKEETMRESQNIMEGASLPQKGPPPQMPTGCCMSGCANCVWIEYAEELAKYYQDGKIAKEAVSRIPDPNLRAFLEMELKFR